ncbi:MAG: DNA polymerase III subunit alpha [Endomicrobium sp.]|jgi:DNA polymerase-3 subunit alpha|nr:DNA polymerase III subunit alpha [Endomicrobium sp.]
MTIDFVHLHNHTEYSLLDGACKLIDENGNPSELFHVIAKKYQMSALAITDHGNMYGAMEFYWAAKNIGIKPIIGCEVYVAPDSCLIKKKNVHQVVYYHLTLLAKDFNGYQNLMRIVSLGFTKGFYYKPRIDKDILNKYSKGLIALSGCLLGEIASNLVHSNIQTAEEIATEYCNIFGKDNFYIEVMDNNIKEQQQIIPLLIKLSKRLSIPLVVTNDCHFLTKDDYEMHNILLCIGTNKTLNDTTRFSLGSNLFYYRSAEEMYQTFSYIPEALQNTLKIAEQINIMIPDNKFLIPHFTTPLSYASNLDYLTTLCNKGLQKKYNTSLNLQHKERLQYELNVIHQMGFTSYFLIVADFIKYAKKNNIPVGPGRGSGAGSIVAYSLDITNICPLKYNLLFERFLNPDRHSMPDLDIDFGDIGREQVIQYVRKKYGEDKCAQIITFGSMQAKLVIRDVARVMGFSNADYNNISCLIPHNTSINEALKTSKELLILMNSNKKINKLLSLSKRLEGIKRHIGMHAAGMVISDQPITNYSPLSRSSKNIITTQYDNTTLTKLGLLKIDFLGLRTLTIIDNTVHLIKTKFDLDNISLNDKNTYKLLNTARTMGVFQLESHGIRNLLKKFKPNCINDLIALIALYRPGPISAKMLNEFINRKNKKTKIVYDHPLEEKILKETYGVILYQEQVMKISEELADFTPWEADNLRIAMSKKNANTIANQQKKFIEGTLQHGINKNIAVKIFNNILAFAGYGFNKSHATAYSIISYQTAYLKANHKLEYFTALLNSEIGHSVINGEQKSKIELYLNDANNFGIKILPPDIQYSKGKFTIENDSIRFGLLAIKNVGKNLTNYIENCNNNLDRRFISWEDFLQKIDLKSINKKVLENLIKSGACDSFGENKFDTRINLLINLKSSINKTLKIQALNQSSQLLLFNNMCNCNVNISKQANKVFEEYEIINFEKDVLGFYLSEHPLKKIQHEFVKYSHYQLNTLPKSNMHINIVGMITSINKFISKNNKELYTKFIIEDLYGHIEALVFLKEYTRFDNIIRINNIVIVSGKLSIQNKNKKNIIVDNIIELSQARENFAIMQQSSKIYVQLKYECYNNVLIDKLKIIFDKYKGSIDVYIYIIDLIYGSFVIPTNYKVILSQAFIVEIELAIGRHNVVKYFK